ncbi:hypothetical protein FGO68_gene17389 [Halteria grandinella]|uniref:Uncharacterized protein n=1 Tax=Halteria grandinella TaxID=5974 RepID=A0A8J8P705_HALGN|nr:hypothetical protein FGO68_gene17389 [Halteria grandinella]
MFALTHTVSLSASLISGRQYSLFTPNSNVRSAGSSTKQGPPPFVTVNALFGLTNIFNVYSVETRESQIVIVAGYVPTGVLMEGETLRQVGETSEKADAGEVSDIVTDCMVFGSRIAGSAKSKRSPCGAETSGKTQPAVSKVGGTLCSPEREKEAVIVWQSWSLPSTTSVYVPNPSAAILVSVISPLTGFTLMGQMGSLKLFSSYVNTGLAAPPIETAVKGVILNMRVASSITYVSVALVCADDKAVQSSGATGDSRLHWDANCPSNSVETRLAVVVEAVKSVTVKGEAVKGRAVVVKGKALGVRVIVGEQVYSSIDWQVD